MRDEDRIDRDPAPAPTPLSRSLERLIPKTAPLPERESLGSPMLLLSPPGGTRGHTTVRKLEKSKYVKEVRALRKKKETTQDNAHATCTCKGSMLIWENSQMRNELQTWRMTQTIGPGIPGGGEEKFSLGNPMGNVNQA